jgi:hypothetical protein
MVSFIDVKNILSKAASHANVGVVDLQTKHDPSFPNLYGDFTNAQLKAGVAKGRRLIQPELIPAAGVIGTRGGDANLVLALKGLLGGVRQMPGGGPPVSAPDIDIVIDWINHGCPD